MYDVDWEIEHSHFYDRQNVLWGIERDEETVYDRVKYRYNLRDLQEQGATTYFRSVCNKIQIYLKRHSKRFNLPQIKASYIWIYDEGEEYGRLHFHMLFPSHDPFAIFDTL